jgi:Uma2 family endonuclease
MTELDQRPALMTVEELLAIPDDDRGYELVNGELRVSEPPSFWHGTLVVRLTSALHTFVAARGLGMVVTEAGFVLRRGPDTVRGPDVAFVGAYRLRAGAPEGYFEGPPDLVAEVVSPGDRAGEILEKVEGYLSSGVSLVWVVYPRQRRVAVHTPDNTATVLGTESALDGADVVPGFRLELAELFAALPNAEAPRA